MLPAPCTKWCSESVCLTTTDRLLQIMLRMYTDANQIDTYRVGVCFLTSREDFEPPAERFSCFGASQHDTVKKLRETRQKRPHHKYPHKGKCGESKNCPTQASADDYHFAPARLRCHCEAQQQKVQSNNLSSHHSLVGILVTHPVGTTRPCGGLLRIKH